MFHGCHPDFIHNIGELFYARVATRVYNVLANTFGERLDDLIITDTAIDIAAYLEDKVSGLGLWNAYEAMHREKYGTDFPFYDITHEERYKDEPNESDIRLLIAYDVNRYADGRACNFLNPIFDDPVNAVFDILIEEFENAPANTELYNWLYDPKAYEDTFQMRERLMWLFHCAYLTYMDVDEEELDEDLKNIGNQFKFEFNEKLLAYQVDCMSVMTMRIGPIAEPSYRWLLEMIRQSEDPKINRNASRFNNFRAIPTLSLFRAISVNKKIMKAITHNKKTITISFDMLNDYNAQNYKKGSTFFTNLFYYNSCWHFNGSSFILNKEFNNDFDKYADSHNKEIAKERLTYEASIELNGGKPIGVARDYETFKRKLKLNKVPSLSNPELEKEISKYKDILYFIPKNGSINIIPDLARSVKLPYNRLYDRENAMVEGMFLTISDTLPDELRNYIISNNLLPDSLFPGAADNSFMHKWYERNRMCLNDMHHTGSQIESNFEIDETIFDE